jgi:hypothetical protein
VVGLFSMRMLPRNDLYIHWHISCMCSRELIMDKIRLKHATYRNTKLEKLWGMASVRDFGGWCHGEVMRCPDRERVDVGFLLWRHLLHR